MSALRTYYMFWSSQFVLWCGCVLSIFLRLLVSKRKNPHTHVCVAAKKAVSVFQNFSLQH